MSHGVAVAICSTTTFLLARLGQTRTHTHTHIKKGRGEKRGEAKKEERKESLRRWEGEESRRGVALNQNNYRCRCSLMNAKVNFSCPIHINPLHF